MAITREKKETIIVNVSELAESSKLIVFANYSGLSVANMQALRAQAKENGVKVIIAKNRLIKLALAKSEKFGVSDQGFLTGQLLLAAGDDEVAPAQTLANFAKTQPSLEIIGALDGSGQVLEADRVKALAALPSKDMLRGQLVGTIAAPLSGLVNVLSGNLRGLINVINARVQAFE